MAKKEDPQNGLLTPTLIPNFTVWDLLGITVLFAVALAICPLLPSWVDAAVVMFAAACFAVGLLYRQLVGIAIAASFIGLISAGVIFCVQLL